VTEPSRFTELKELPEPSKEDIDLMTKIVDKLTVDYDLSEFHDGYKERIGAMIEAKMEGQVAEVKEKGPKKPVAKSMMEALRKTAESLK
jgi:non-homologous end joining protein Ku